MSGEAGRGRYIDRFEAVVFDLNGTLATGHDRFGPGEDFHATYRALGGRRLGPGRVEAILRGGLERLLERYEGGETDGFPDIGHFLARAGAPAGAERARLAEVVAVHEEGRIPAGRRALLRRLAATHRLGLVSNLWAPAGRWRARLEAQGVADCFGVLVFSCEAGAVKPHPSLFERALSALAVSPERAVFVGDDPARDVSGAAAVGMATVLVGRGGAGCGADRVIASVEELETL